MCLCFECLKKEEERKKESSFSQQICISEWSFIKKRINIKQSDIFFLLQFVFRETAYLHPSKQAMSIYFSEEKGGFLGRVATSDGLR